jgi:hypothetical protein
MGRLVAINFAHPQPSIKRHLCLGPSLWRRYVGSAWCQLAVDAITPANEYTKLPAAFSLHPKDCVAEPSGLAGRSPMGAKRKTMIVTGASHFAAWEQPDYFVAELRAAFRSLRTAN